MLRGWMKAPSHSGRGWVRVASCRLVSSAFLRRSRLTVRNAATNCSRAIVPRSGRSSGSLVERNCSVSSTVPDGNRRGLSSAGRGRETLLPASSSAQAVMVVKSGRFQGSANSVTARPLSAAPAGKAGKKTSPTLTPLRAAPFTRRVASPPPP